MRNAIVIPTYNEADNIADLLHALLKDTDARVVVVDDSSPDGTAGIVRTLENERVHLIERSGKQGIGSAYRDGFTEALKHHPTKILQMDADFSHRVEDVKRMLAESDQADLLIGSRYSEGGSIKGWNPWRHFCSRSAIAFSRWMLRLPARDITSGLRLWDAELLRRVLEKGIRSNGYAFQEEMLFHATKLDAGIREMPITFIDRKHGKSKLGWRDVREFFQTIDRLRKQL